MPVMRGMGLSALRQPSNFGESWRPLDGYFEFSQRRNVYPPHGNRLKLSFSTLQEAQAHDYAALDSHVRSMYISSDKEIIMTTVEAIRNRINEIGMGEPFTSSQFNALGTRPAVDQALSRFVKQGEITRISRGVFVRPKRSRYIGEVMPEPSKVAKA